MSFFDRRKLLSRLQLEALPLPHHQRHHPPLHRRNHPELRQHPRPRRREHGDPPHLRHAALLLHEALRLQHGQQGLD